MSLPKTIVFVFFGHILVLSSLYFSQKSSFHPPKKTVVRVFEKRLQQRAAPTRNIQQVILKKEEKKSEEKKTAPVKEKKEVVKTVSEKKPPAATVAIPKRENNNVVKEVSKKSLKEDKKEIVKKPLEKKNDLLDQLSNLASFDTKEQKTNKLSGKVSDLPVPKLKELKTPLVDIDIGEVQTETAKTDFQNVLIEHFRKNLSLPEYGEVKIKLALNSDGTICDVAILHSKSKKNEEYLKNTLPNLTFPWFNLYLPNEKKLVLTISFLNDI